MYCVYLLNNYLTNHYKTEESSNKRNNKNEFIFIPLIISIIIIMTYCIFLKLNTGFGHNEKVLWAEVQSPSNSFYNISR